MLLVTLRLNIAYLAIVSALEIGPYVAASRR